MVYKILQISRDVRIAIDENKTSEQLLAEEDVDTLSLDEIIRSKILEAVRRVHTDAPPYMLEGGHHFGDAIYWESLNSGWVILPRDFMRLIVFRMTDWERPVYTAIDTYNPDYEKQSSRFRGIRGTTQKPVCVIAIRPEGRVLEFYSCKSENAQVAQAVYAPLPFIDADGGIDICPRCYESIVYMAAALVCTTLSEGDKAAAFTELAKSALQ